MPDPGHQEWLENQKARKEARKKPKTPPPPPPPEPPKSDGGSRQDFDPVLW